MGFEPRTSGFRDLRSYPLGHRAPRNTWMAPLLKKDWNDLRDSPEQLVFQSQFCHREVDDGHLDADLGQVVRVRHLRRHVELKVLVVLYIAVSKPNQQTAALSNVNVALRTLPVIFVTHNAIFVTSDHNQLPCIRLIHDTLSYLLEGNHLYVIFRIMFVIENCQVVLGYYCTDMPLELNMGGKDTAVSDCTI